MILVPVDNTFSVSTIDHDALLNTHNLTTDIDHTAIQNIGSNTHAQIDTHLGLVNEHIDWTNATQTLATSGNITTTGAGLITSNTSVDATTFVNATTDYRLGDTIIIDNPPWNNFKVGSGALGSMVGGGQYNLAFGQDTLNKLTGGWHNAIVGNTGGYWHVSSHRIAGVGADFSKGYNGVPQVWDVAGAGVSGFANNIGKYVSGVGSYVGENNTGDYCHFGGYQCGKNNTISYRIAFETSGENDYPLFDGRCNDDTVTLNAFPATDSVVHRVLYLQRATSAVGHGANGIGTGLEFRIEEAAGNVDSAGYMDCSYTDATGASEDADIIFGLMAAGAAAAEKARLTSGGDFKISNDFYSGGNQGLSGTLTLDDGANWRITLTFNGGILSGQTTGASSAATATWV